MPAATVELRVPIGDDAAVLADGTAITVDTLVEGVHFDGRLSPEDVGWKAVAASVSDLAAMGARPQWAVLSLSIQAPTDTWIDAFGRGFGQAAARFGVSLIGGDTTSSPGPTVVGVTLAGACVAAPLRRDGAGVGDHLWLTGCPGLAGAGWMLADPGPASLRALRRPEPPLAFALALAQAGLATAAMDISDGLASDLPRLAAASGLGATLRESDLPRHSELDNQPAQTARTCQLAGGDDYELLFAAKPANATAIRSIAADHGVAVHHVGCFTEDRAVRASGGPWPTGGFDHFAEAS